MKNRRFFNNNHLLPIILLFVGVISFLIMVFSGKIDSSHLLIVLLPIAVIVSAFIVSLFKVGDKLKIVSLALLFFYVFRYAFVSVIAVYGSYTIDVSSNIYVGNFNKACVLMFFEMIIAVLVLCALGKYKSGSVSKKRVFNTNNYTFLWVLFFLTVAYCFAVLIRYPILRSNFFLLISSDGSRMQAKYTYAAASSSVPSLFFYTFVFLVEVLRIVIPLLIISYLYKSKLMRPVKYLLIILVLLLNVMITTHVQITGLLVASLVMLYLMEKDLLFRRIMILPLLAFLAFVMVRTMNSYSGARNIESFSRVMQNYFAGPSLIASGISMPRGGSSSYVLVDLLYANSFLGPAFKIGLQKTSTELFFSFIKDTTRSSIFPALAQTYYYFGPVIAPFIGGFAAFVVFRIEKYAYSLNNRFFKMLFLFFAFKVCVSVSMYFAYSIIQVLADYVLPIIIAGHLNSLFANSMAHRVVAKRIRGGI